MHWNLVNMKQRNLVSLYPLEAVLLKGGGGTVQTNIFLGN